MIYLAEDSSPPAPPPCSWSTASLCSLLGLRLQSSCCSKSLLFIAALAHVSVFMFVKLFLFMCL